MSYHNATYLKARYQTLRSRGICLDCKGVSVKFTRCKGCRDKRNADRRKAA